jgi:hypothetical protein
VDRLGAHVALVGVGVWEEHEAMLLDESLDGIPIEFPMAFLKLICDGLTCELLQISCQVLDEFREIVELRVLAYVAMLYEKGTHTIKRLFARILNI